MKNLNLLPVNDEIKKDIRLSSDRLLGFGGIQVDILDVTGNVITVRVIQIELKNGYILSGSELSQRAATLFLQIENDFEIHYRPLTYEPKLNEITPEWVKASLKEFNLSRNDLIKQLGLDKSTVSTLMSGKKDFTRFQKAAFFYYFLTYRLNKEFRVYLNDIDK